MGLSMSTQIMIFGVPADIQPSDKKWSSVLRRAVLMVGIRSEFLCLACLDALELMEGNSVVGWRRAWEQHKRMSKWIDGILIESIGLRSDGVTLNRWVNEFSGEEATKAELTTYRKRWAIHLADELETLGF